MRKIYITGGAGYVGAVMVPYLLKQGYQITVIDLMIYGKEVIKPHKNLKIIEGDIRDQPLLESTLKGHDTVIHLACISNDPSFELNPKLGRSINLESFKPLVEAAIKSDIERFIYASSSSVYGVKKEKDVDENMLLEPLTDYSKFKAECEKILLNYKNYSNFTPVILRPATVCGFSPRQRLDVVVNILTNLAYHKREISVFGGSQLRPNIHIYDMVRAYECLLNAKKEDVFGQVFNVGYENQTVEDLAHIVKKVVGEDVKINFFDSNDYRSYHISSKKIQKKLNFFTQKTIEDAVKDLKNAFENKILTNTLSDEKYFNIKKMNNINLK